MKTNIYAITDSHQESRNLSKLLSGVYNFEKDSKTPFLLLDSGDLFKGIYDRELSVNAYLKIKELLPQAQIFITLGNNDFGFKKSDFDYLKQTVEKFKNAGINVICANLIDNTTNRHADWVLEYKIIELNGQKFLITGFCLNNSCAKKFSCDLSLPEDCFKKLIESIKEKYDKIIVLNHHWYTYSKNLKDFATDNGIKIDLIIGGHEHSPIPPDYENNIFYPLSFARTLYKMTIDEKVENIEEISLDKLNFIEPFERPILDYEKKTGLREPITKRVLNLTKCYSDPCPLGTFISDNMRKLGKTDIAFHSTGYTMYPLRLADSDVITKYDLGKVICATTTIETINITVAQLKKVFENAVLNRTLRDRGNARFVQCSRNVTITDSCDYENNTCEIIQIAINGENLLDSERNPIEPNRVFTCTIDPYIGSGEQGFEVLKNLPKTKVLQNGKEVQINELLKNALKSAAQNFDGNPEYPSAKFIDLIE